MVRICNQCFFIECVYLYDVSVGKLCLALMLLLLCVIAYEKDTCC